MTSQSVNGAMSWLAGRLTSDGSEVAASEFLSSEFSSHSFIRVLKLVDGAAVVGTAVVVSASLVVGAAVVVEATPVVDSTDVAGALVSELPPHPTATKRSDRRTADFFTDSVCHHSLAKVSSDTRVHMCKYRQSDSVSSAVECTV